MAKKGQKTKKTKVIKKKVVSNNLSVRYRWMLYGALVGAAVCFYFIITRTI